MRFIGLCLLGIVAFLVTIVALFPAAPVVDRIRPQLGSVALEGVNGKLYKGVIDTVSSTDDLLPLEFQNVGWALAPGALLKGGAGASFSFDGYGGSGQGLAIRSWNGSIDITDFDFNAQAKALEPLLPVPIASFSGELTGNIERLSLVDNLLAEARGTLSWNNAALQTPIPTSLGDVEVVIKPEGEQAHLVTLKASGGDVAMDGSVTLSLNGDFTADVLFTPAPSASEAVRNGLRQMGRADAQGRVRFQRTGNVNRLM
ncbi:type II secretion system protein N [Granulosicoccus sp.]|nr:type II secretion system protein N [Granulosicoccus sp.]MDB4223397.1 type II secretion system protein N [Granulosicoccus sp.]